MSNYESSVKGRTAEQILANDQAWTTNHVVSSYLQIAAQVRSNEELIAELKHASADSGRMSQRLVCLTGVLAIVGIAQAIATAWPYMAYWWHR